MYDSHGQQNSFPASLLCKHIVIATVAHELQRIIRVQKDLLMAEFFHQCICTIAIG